MSAGSLMITFTDDADAVLKPEKLISRIHLMPIPQKGGFLVNCEKVKYGFSNGVLVAFGKCVQTKQSSLE